MVANLITKSAAIQMPENHSIVPGYRWLCLMLRGRGCPNVTCLSVRTNVPDMGGGGRENAERTIYTKMMMK